MSLEEHGFEAYCVGGAVRDLLMGKFPTDYDVATNATPEAVMGIFERTVATGLKHGTVTVIIGNQNIEVTTFRTEDGYSDGRHPDKVSFVEGLGDDLARRDFTVNAIAYSEKRGLIDPMGGRADIENRIIRCVGEAERRFTEDKLRIMRCFRFASVLGFSIEQDTFNAAMKLCGGLWGVSPERLFAELCKMLCGNYIELCAPFFGSGALGFANLKSAKDLKPLSLLPPNAALRFTAYCIISESDLLAAARFFKVSNSFLKEICNIFECFKKDISDIYSARKAAAEFGFDALKNSLLIKKALGQNIYLGFEILEELKNEPLPRSVKELDISGEEVAAQGFEGAEIGKVLDQLFQAVLKNPKLNRKSELLEMLKALK